MFMKSAGPFAQRAWVQRRHAAEWLLTGWSERRASRCPAPSSSVHFVHRPAAAASVKVYIKRKTQTVYISVWSGNISFFNRFHAKWTDFSYHQMAIEYQRLRMYIKWYIYLYSNSFKRIHICVNFIWPVFNYFMPWKNYPYWGFFVSFMCIKAQKQ